MSEEIQLYLGHARLDLEAAEGNLELGFYHIIVSRSYYAMPYATNALLASKGITRSKHSGAIAAFGQHFVKTGIIEPIYAKMLGNAFDSRLDSDYDVAFSVSRSTAVDILEDARQFLSRVDQYFEEIPGENAR